MKHYSLEKKLKLFGWLFVAPASLLIIVLSFYPMIYSFILSLQSGVANNLHFTGLRNYVRLFKDANFKTSVVNVLIYLIIQVPVMLVLALILSTILNQKDLKLKGVFRTLVFLPCVTSLVSSALVFKSLFALDGFVNRFCLWLGVLNEPINFLMDPFWAKAAIIIVITWRWTGYNTIFYLAGLQNLDDSIFEAAVVDGASPTYQFFHITVPLLRPVILLTAIMSTNGTLQIFDEVKNLTNGGPGMATLSISQYIYNLSFRLNPQFGYAAAVSWAILFMVAILSFVQMQIGDKDSD